MRTTTALLAMLLATPALAGDPFNPHAPATFEPNVPEQTCVADLEHDKSACYFERHSSNSHAETGPAPTTPSPATK